MRKNRYIFTLFLGILFLIFLDSCVKDRIEPQVVTSGVIPLGNKTLIHYWNFNDASDLLTPTSSDVFICCFFSAFDSKNASTSLLFKFKLYN